MKLIALLLSLTSLNLYAVCGVSGSDSGINTLVTDECDPSKPSDRAIILNQQIKGGENGEEIKSSSLNLKFEAIDKEIAYLNFPFSGKLGKDGTIENYQSTYHPDSITSTALDGGTFNYGGGSGTALSPTDTTISNSLKQNFTITGTNNVSYTNSHVYGVWFTSSICYLVMQSDNSGNGGISRFEIHDENNIVLNSTDCESIARGLDFNRTGTLEFQSGLLTGPFYY